MEVTQVGSHWSYPVGLIGKDKMTLTQRAKCKEFRPQFDGGCGCSQKCLQLYHELRLSLNNCEGFLSLVGAKKGSQAFTNSTWEDKWKGTHGPNQTRHCPQRSERVQRTTQRDAGQRKAPHTALELCPAPASKHLWKKRHGSQQKKKKGTISPCKLKRIEIMWSSFPTTAPIPRYPEEWRLRRLDYLLLDMAQLNSIVEICIISTPIS